MALTRALVRQTRLPTFSAGSRALAGRAPLGRIGLPLRKYSASYSSSSKGNNSKREQEEAGPGWKWRPIPVALGIAFLGGFQVYRIRRRQQSLDQAAVDAADDDGTDPARRQAREGAAVESDGTETVVPRNKVRSSTPWQVRVLSTLPLKALSRLWGRVNELDIPKFLRVPGLKLYSWIFGVNLDEVERDLQTYPNLASFFYRALKPGSRPLDPNPNALLSPADGKIVQYGVIRHGEVEQVKGMTYRIDALLGSSDSPPHPDGGAGADSPGRPARPAEPVLLDEAEFARVNGISYTLPDMMSGSSHRPAATIPDQSTTPSAGSEAAVQSALQDGPGEHAGELELRRRLGSLFKLRPGAAETDLHFCVIYLAPGDYHRFHSPASWVVERRRHFAGELYSVSPYLVRLLPGLFTLNERVVLLGRWKWGFFSMTPVGATNVGSIRINFDHELRTNSLLTDTAAARAARAAALADPDYTGFVEASYRHASDLLRGQPLRRGEEVGSFRLGSTVVLVFETPRGGEDGKGPSWRWAIDRNQRIKVGEALGYIEDAA